jgi:DNA-binding NarL/FixJ family response regulator
MLTAKLFAGLASILTLIAFLASSVDVVQEALSLGARGYVAKLKAHVDLFAAVEAVLLGMTFVSNL